jgi:hypothetical protein
MKILKVSALFFFFTAALATVHPQAVCGLSSGAGIGFIRHDFTESGTGTPLRYIAPSLNLAGELAWGNWYMEMALAVLISPFSVQLGKDKLSLDGYKANSGADFTALGIGYLTPLSEKLEAGGAVGFHVSGFFLSPPNGDPDLLTIEGYYGTIGISLTPRLRYKISNRLRCTVSIPIGLDFAPMSDEVVTSEGQTGVTNPAVIRPAGLDPDFTGITAGISITLGYFFQLKR